jgi:protein-disulfide isomerase
MEPNTQAQQNPFLVPLAIVAAGAMIALAVYFGGSNPSNLANVSANKDVKVEPVTGEDHIIGSLSAPIVLIEYSDTECPFCKVYHNTVKQVMQNYGTDVAWVYRHLPIPQLHARAEKEAEATECVAELGGNQAFWAYLDKIFTTTNSNDSLDPAQLPKLAVQVGVNEAAFNNCLSSGKYTEAVRKSAEKGFAAGARGTPFTVIMTPDGQKGVINGAEPYESVKAKLDAIL